uniref:Uncharacterized protein n=2 Tax=Guillardia theta TaxID=55529 RepID=A0A7S4HB01_GUITH
MNESAQRSDRLEDELGKCYEDLRVSRQSEEASEIALKVQTELVEKSNAQIKQLTEELRQVRESQNEWRSKCEEYRLKLEQLSGSGDIESMREQLMQLKAQNNEYNRLRLLDAEKIATQQAAIERLDELEDKLNGKERSLRESKQEADNWRAKAEAFSAELLAWRSKSESWESTKASSVKSLQAERDRLQVEWQLMRESLQSAEATLAVQTAAVQRLEAELTEEKQRNRDGYRALESWEEKENSWKREILAIRTRMEDEISSRKEKIDQLHKTVERLEEERDELGKTLSSAEASLAVQTAAVQRLEKQSSTLLVEVRQCRRSEEEWKMRGEEALAEVKSLQIQLDDARKKKDETLRSLHESTDTFETTINDLRKAYGESESRGKMYMNENEKLQKELEVLRDSMKDLEAMKKDYERMRYELVALKSAGMNGNNSANGFKQIQDERDRILRELEILRPKYEEMKAETEACKAINKRLEADVQQLNIKLGESEGRAEKFHGEAQGYKSEVASLRMQLEDAVARSEHAIATLREERDILHSELERLRNSLQAASAEVTAGMQSVAKLSNVDARTVSSQVRVYGDAHTLQGQLHQQMDVFRQQTAQLRGSSARPRMVYDEFRPAAGKPRRRAGGRPDGGSLALGGQAVAGNLAGALVRSRNSNLQSSHADGGGKPFWDEERRTRTQSTHRPSSANYHPPPPRLTGKDFRKYEDISLVEEAAEWLAAQRGRHGCMPSEADLRAAGMSGVADAVMHYHGGIEAVATRLSMQIHHSTRSAAIGHGVVNDPSHWNKFSHVRQAVLELAEALCSPDTMPSYAAMRASGFRGLADAVRSKYGGLKGVAETLGLQLSSAFAEL